MKSFYTLKIQIQETFNELEGKNIKELANKTVFVLKTTGFNKIISDIYADLGSLVNITRVGISKANIKSKLKLPYEMSSGIKIEINASAPKIAILYTVGHWDEYSLGDLDGKTLAQMSESNGEG